MDFLALNTTSANSTLATHSSSVSIANTTSPVITSSADPSLHGISTIPSPVNSTITLASNPNSTAVPLFNNATTTSAPFPITSAFTSLAPTTTANPYFNGTDLNNATRCWPAYWSYSSMTWSWSRARVTVITKTYTYTQTIRSGLPEPSANGTFSTLCDGLPRFGSDAEATNATILLPTPVVTTTTYLSENWIWPTTSFPSAPSCPLRNTDECSAAWSLFGSSLSSSNDAWSTSNILTVSLASPPTSVLVNNKATPLTAPPGALPTITLHGEAYTADQGIYHISGGVNLYGEDTLTPGGQNILTWNMDQSSKPFGPTGTNCTRPTGNIIQSRCATAQCTIAAYSVELLYFPPPTMSRDMCANTSPSYNSYSVSIYSQPHSSTVINSTTYWSDKAYVRYAEVSAFKYCDLDNQLGRTRVSVGGTYTNRVIEVSSSDISSICDWQYAPTGAYAVIGATAKPFNFEDMVGDIPASAYQCMPRCQSHCQSIVTDYFVPGLAVPPQVRAQDPAWASCVPVFDRVPDPPIALGPVPSFLASTTGQTPHQTDPPSPGQTIPTAAPDPTQKPTQPPITTRFTSTIPLPTTQPAPNDPKQPTDPDPDPNSDPNPNNPNPSNPNPINPNPNNPNPNPVNPNAPVPNDPNPGRVTKAPTGPTPVATIGNSVVSADPSHPGTIIVANPNSPGSAQTLTLGGKPIVISGTTVSVNPTSGAVVISGDTTLQPVGTIGGKPVFVDESQPGIVIIGDPRSGQPTQTLDANGPSIVIDGTTLSLGPLATPFSSPSSTTVDGISISRMADGTFLINNAQTLRPGDPQISYNGHSFAVDANGVILMDGQQVQLSPSTTQSATTIDGISLVLLPNGKLLVNGETTLQPGDPQITVNGHTILLDPSGSVIVDGQKINLSQASTTNQTGDLIIVGPDGTTTTVHMPTATDPAEVIAALAEALNGALASTALSGSQSKSVKQTPATSLFASVTGGVGDGSETAAPPQSSSKKSAGVSERISWSSMAVGMWFFMIATLWA